MEPPSTVLEEAFARHRGELLGTLFYLLGNLDDAQDALQEAFVRCWRHRETVPAVDNVRAWLFRVVLNTGRDLRDSAWRRRRRPLAGAETMLISQSSPPEQQLIQDEELGLLRRALLELSADEQEVFLLRQNGELTYDEIAASVGAPVGTVKTRMRSALHSFFRGPEIVILPEKKTNVFNVFFISASHGSSTVTGSVNSSAPATDVWIRTLCRMVRNSTLVRSGGVGTQIRTSFALCAVESTGSAVSHAIPVGSTFTSNGSADSHTKATVRVAPASVNSLRLKKSWRGSIRTGG